MHLLPLSPSLPIASRQPTYTHTHTRNTCCEVHNFLNPIVRINLVAFTQNSLTDTIMGALDISVEELLESAQNEAAAAEAQKAASGARSADNERSGQKNDGRHDDSRRMSDRV